MAFLWRRISAVGGVRKAFWDLLKLRDLRAGKLVGTDVFGNKYYENKDHFFPRNRWVYFARRDYDASQIPPEWHHWLHNIGEHNPVSHPPEEKKFLTEHTENLSGTNRDTRICRVKNQTRTPVPNVFTDSKKSLQVTNSLSPANPNMKLIAAFTMIVLAATLCEASSDCQWGPSYWCQSKTTAQQCNKEQYCIENVWKVKGVSVSGGIECSICKMVVEEVDKYVVNNSTEAEAQQAIDSLCSSLGALSSACKDLVDQNFPQIWQLLVDQTDPDKVCSEISLCSSTKKSKPTSVFTKVGSVQCDVCVLLIKQVESAVLNNKTEAEIEQEVEKVCALLGSLKDECDTLVEKDLPNIINMITNKVDPQQICGLIGLCKNSMRTSLLTVSKVKSVQCDVCKLLIKQVENYILNNKTENQTQQELDDLCSKLGSLGDECKTFVDDYFPKVWQELVNDADPATICAVVGLCKSAAIKLPIECELCDIVIEKLVDLVLSNTTEEVAKAEVEKVCTYLGGFASECKSLINDNWDTLWDLVKKELDDPKLVCETIFSSCKNQTTFFKLKSNSTIPCALCELLVPFLQYAVDEDSDDIESNLVEIISDICDYFPHQPKDYVKECVDWVKTYVPIIWRRYKDEIDHDEICKDVNLCPTLKKKPAPKPVLKTMPKQNLCDLCKLAVSFLKTYVDSNTTEKEVKDAIEGLCALLPKNTSDQCTKLVEDNFDMIWDLLKKEVDDDTICKQLGLCNSTLSVSLSRAQPKAQPTEGLCDMCKLAANFLKPYVDNNSTEQEVIAAVDSLCGYLPSDMSDQCKDFADNYLKQMWQAVQKEFDTNKICSDLGLCSTATTLLVGIVLQNGGIKDDSMLCFLCYLGDAFLKEFVNNSTNENDVIGGFQKICVILPPNITNQCIDFVRGYIPKVWKIMQLEINSGQLCYDVTACTNNSLIAAIKTATKSKVAGPACDVCKLLMEYLKPFADNKTTEDKAVQAVKNLCSDLPDKYAQECQAQADKYVRQIWDDIRGQIDDGSACGAFCSSYPALALVKVPAPKSTPHPVKDTPCTTCKMVVLFLKQYLEENNTKEEAKKDVEKVCDSLPGSFKNECSSLVDEFFDKIWELLESYVDDDDICKEIKMCGNSAVTQSVKGGVLCVLCEYVMKELESILATNATEAEVEAALDKVCSLLPSTIQSDCDEFVKKYAKDIIDEILNGALPKTVCAVLGLCTVSEQTVVLSVTTESSAINCETCTLLIGTVKLLVKDDEKPVEEVLETVCKYMPSTIQAECKSFIETFTPQIIQLLDNEIDPKSVCKDLKLCESALLKPWTKLPRARLY